MSTSVEKELIVVDSKHIIRKYSFNDETKKVVEIVMSGKYYFFKGLDIVDFSNGIDWNYQHNNSANSYQLYLHSLEVINHLCVYCEKTKDINVLKKAQEIIIDWINYDKSSRKKGRHVWYNHTVSSRASAIVYFYYLSNDLLKLDEKLYYDYLLKHAEFLFDDKYYVENNHGIMMDRALLILSLTLKNNPNSATWQQKALFRLKEAFNRDFSHKGVHLENSPDYHSMVRRMFVALKAFLVKNKLSLGEEINNKLDKTNEYFKYLYKPDKTIPIIGDTSHSKNRELVKKYEPFMDDEAGITILQDENPDNPELSTWISFVCGYGSKTHKHFDDLSVNLFYKGKDILIDSGKYNYNMGDKYRNYIISPRAHSTISVEGETYNIGDPILEKDNVAITDFTSNEYYDLVKGKNHSYKNIQLERTLIFFKPDILLIFDRALSDVENRYLQTFNLAHHIEVSYLKNGIAKIRSEDELVEIIQLIGNCNSTSYHGDHDIPRAVYSEKFGKLIDNHQVEFSQIGKSVNFLTMIKMGKGNKRVRKTSYDQKYNILKIRIDKKRFNIPL